MSPHDARLEGEPGMASPPKRVLIVDDDPHVLALLQDQFSRHYVVEAVSNGSQALGVVLRRRPDVIVLDIVLPGVDGVELLAAFREFAAGIPVIVITGQDNEAMAERALALGAFGYVPKPFDLASLDRLVVAALRAPRAR